MKLWIVINTRLRILFHSTKKSTKSGLLKYFLFFVLGFFFLASINFVFFRILTYFNQVPLFGPILIAKLLSMVFLTFFTMLLFSNVVVSISTLYLSEDLNLLMANPIPVSVPFTMKGLETLINSSWMILIMSIPIFVAYGMVCKAEFIFYPVAVTIFIPFLLIATAIALFFTIFLMRIFPARRTRDIFVLLSIGFVCIVVVLFRLLQPERLVNPSEIVEVMQYIAELKAPTAPYLPSYWASQAAIFALYRKWGQFYYYYSILWGSAIMVVFMLLLVAKKNYYPAWCNAQETHEVKIKNTFLERINWDKIFNFLPSVTRVLLVKDIKIFRRDPTQWPQLLLLFSIVIIYLFNMHTLPLDKLPINIYSKYLKDLIFFLNMGFSGFIIAAVGARFVFSSVSMEGKSYWLVRLAPITVKKFLLEKFWINFFILFVLAEVLILCSVYLMKIDIFMAIISLWTVFLFSITLTALGIGLGSMYPKFYVDNPAEIATSFGGLLYMVTSILYITLILILESGPVRMYYMHKISFSLFDVGYVGFIFVLIIFVSILTCYIPMKLGMRNLLQMEL
ncbi:MAG: hypothetical protein AABY84_08375 [Candidatus Firestonebacteria bacterium]